MIDALYLPKSLLVLADCLRERYNGNLIMVTVATYWLKNISKILSEILWSSLLRCCASSRAKLLYLTDRLYAPGCAPQRRNAYNISSLSILNKWLVSKLKRKTTLLLCYISIVYIVYPRTLHNRDKCSQPESRELQRPRFLNNFTLEILPIIS